MFLRIPLVRWKVANSFKIFVLINVGQSEASKYISAALCSRRQIPQLRTRSFMISGEFDCMVENHSILSSLILTLLSFPALGLPAHQPRFGTLQLSSHLSHPGTFCKLDGTRRFVTVTRWTQKRTGWQCMCILAIQFLGS